MVFTEAGLGDELKLMTPFLILRGRLKAGLKSERAHPFPKTAKQDDDDLPVLDLL